MKNANSKRLLTLVMALVLVFALSVGALAAWPSFQNDETNNGVITSTPPITANPTVSPVPLSTNGYAYSGVDTTPVIVGDNAYVLYNAGDVDTTTGAGGARLACVDMTPTDPSDPIVFDIQLDTDANNCQQLSTPYYDEFNDIIYAGVTCLENELADTPLSYWNSGAISGNTIIIPAHTEISLTLNAMVQHGEYSNAYFTINTWSHDDYDFSGSVTMYNWTEQTLYSLGTSHSYADSYFSLYNNNGTPIPSGTYTVTITLQNNTDTTRYATGIDYMLYKWKIYAISDADTDSPICSSPLKTGYGQVSTPITGYDDYLYFGIYQGDRSYYQLNITDTDDFLRVSNYNGEGFYWAGAVIAYDPEDADDFVYFGGEGGYVFKRPIGDDFDNASEGAYKNLSTIVSGPGGVRCSICYDGNDLYLTTLNGYLWKLTPDLASAAYIDLKDATYVQKSTSTPVVSDNNYIYVGGYTVDFLNSVYSGAIKAVPKNSFTQNSLALLWGKNNSDGAVQSSVIVYSVTTGTATDYLYFTTNCPSGCGYCISNTAGTVANVWDTSNLTSYNYYCVQGMASDGGYVVFGNDWNNLFVIH